MKKIETDTDHELVIRISSTLIAWIGAAGLFFLADILRTLFFHAARKDRLFGLAGASVTCILIFLVFHEKCTFRFDRRTRILAWSRQRGFAKRAGTLPFSEIKNVVLQSCMGNTREYPKHRVALVTSEGELPLMVAYEHDDMNQTVAERIRAALEMDAAKLVEESVEALVAKGADLDAVRLLREKRGLSLSEARAQVARIRENKHPRPPLA